MSYCKKRYNLRNVKKFELYNTETKLEKAKKKLYYKKYEKYILNIIESYEDDITDLYLETFCKGLVKFWDALKMDRNTQFFSFYYIDKLISKNKIFITTDNIFMFIIISNLITIKYNNDYSISNKDYAQALGYDKKEINKLEFQFLDLIDYELYIDEKDIKKIEKKN
jgi:hypothetical protein